jgi:hypothetical protein
MRYKLILIFVWILTSPVLATFYEYNTVPQTPQEGSYCDCLTTGTFRPVVNLYYNNQPVYKRTVDADGAFCGPLDQALYYTGTYWRVNLIGAFYPIEGNYCESVTAGVSGITGIYVLDMFMQMSCEEENPNVVVTQGDREIIVDTNDYNNLTYNGDYYYRATGSYEIDFPEDYFAVGTQDFTICYWFKPTWGTQGKNYTGFTFLQGQGNGPSFVMTFDPSVYNGIDINRIEFSMKTLPNQADVIYAYCGGCLDIKDKWVFLATSVDRDGNATLYANGQIIGQGDVSSFAAVDFSPWTAVLTYGGYPDLHTGNTSSVDDFRFYTGRALTQAELLTIYGSGRGGKVSQEEFGALATNGFYCQFDNCSALQGNPFGIAEQNGVFTSRIKIPVDLYGSGGSAWPYHVAGGVPFGSSVNKRKGAIDFRGW